MLLADPPPTPYDLRFRLFGTDVRIHPLFWLMSIILGWNLVNNPNPYLGNGMADLAVWVMACFLSILLHEFGHVWMGRAFGSHGHIVLYSMGGLAVGAQGRRSWQRMLISAAGPGIQLLLWAALFGLRYADYRPDPGTPLDFLFWIMLSINLYWALLNLLPIWPLDGGQIMREICASISPTGGVIAALYISLGLSAVVAVNALMGYNGKPFLPRYAPTGMWPVILFGMLAVGSWQAIQYEKQMRQEYRFDDSLPWER